MADKNIPAGLSRRELWVDARDIQSEQEDGEAMSEAEYLTTLATRGAEKLAKNQLVQSFNATIRTHDPTYKLGVDFFLGDTITVTDERLGVSIDAVVQGVERSVSRDGESMSLILGYAQPTLHERLQRKATK